MDPICPSCQSPAYRVEARRGQVSFGRCLNCQLAYLHPLEERAVEDTVANQSTSTNHSYVDAIFANGDRRVAVAKSLLPRRLDVYRRMLSREPKRVLEVGCADGAWWPAYRDAGIDWLGIEVDDDLAEHAQSRGVPLAKMSFLDFKSDRPFDVVYASQVLEHFLDPNEFVAKVASLLAPDGLLHVDVPNHESAQATIQRINPRNPHHGFLELPHHKIAYTRKAIRALLERHGMVVEVLGAKASDDATFGQLERRTDAVSRVLYRAFDLVKKGSLLVAVARLGASEAQPIAATTGVY